MTLHSLLTDQTRNVIDADAVDRMDDAYLVNVARGGLVATPHVAWYSESADEERRRCAAENVRAVLAGDRPTDAVVDPTE